MDERNAVGFSDRRGLCVAGGGGAQREDNSRRSWESRADLSHQMVRRSDRCEEVRRDRRTDARKNEESERDAWG